MTLYETLFIIHPDQGGKVKEFTDRFKKVIEGLDGVVSQIDEWGLRDLAFRIRKQTKGYYALLQYRSTSHAVNELERNMKLTDGVLRYLTVRLDTDAMPRLAEKDIPAEARGSSEEDLAKPNPQS